MPGTLTLRPLVANLTRDTEIFGEMDPYCKITLGNQKLSGQVCRNGGKHPEWEDTIILRRINENICEIEVKEKDWLLPDAVIGGCQINLKEVEEQKRVLKWYPLIYQDKPAGKILIEITYEPDKSLTSQNKNIQIHTLKQLNQQITNDAGKTEKQKQNLSQNNNNNDTEKKNEGGYLQGIILGWNPFSKNNQQSKDETNKENQKVQTVSDPVQRPEAGNGNISNEYIQYRAQNQGYMTEGWSNINTDQNENYLQKYPQFDQQQYPNSYSNDYNIQTLNSGNSFNPSNYSNMNDQGNRQSNEKNSYSGSDQVNKHAYQIENKDRIDPLQVIRGL